jgi:DNA polymerase-3 subunit epsilon
VIFGWLRRKKVPWRQQPLWALDLEATGLDPKQDQILSVGMVPVRGGRVIYGESWYALVRPPRDHRPQKEALRIHHILPEEAVGAPHLREVLDGIFERLGNDGLLVHHKSLDQRLLEQACRATGRRWPRPEIVDTLDLLSKMSRRRRMLEPHAEPYSTSLAFAREEFGLPPHRAHHALADAVATAELYLVLQHRLED